MNHGASISERARSAARGGRIGYAVDMLHGAAKQGASDALFELGVWLLAGEFVRRDLAASREFFRRAGAGGHRDGLRIYNAFLANGTGGAADWIAAVDLLGRRACLDASAARQHRLIGSMRIDADGDPQDLPSAELLATSPYVALFRGLLTQEECAFLVDTAEPLMRPAVIVDPGTGQQIRNPIRTSDAAGFTLVDENPAIHALNRRIAAASGIAVGHGEPLQILRYGPGQHYRLHSDALPGADNQRVATVLIYLSDIFAGGETHFPAIDLKVRGAIGDALLFRNVTPDGRTDDRAVHAGLPVATGTKLIASRWIRARPLDLNG